MFSTWLIDIIKQISIIDSHLTDLQAVSYLQFLRMKDNCHFRKGSPSACHPPVYQGDPVILPIWIVRINRTMTSLF